jgi:hypothetical protein
MDQDLMELLQLQQAEQQAQMGPEQKATIAELYKKQQEDAAMQKDLLKQQLEAHIASQGTPIDFTPLAALLKEYTGSDAPMAAAQSLNATNKADQARSNQLADNLFAQKAPSGEFAVKALLGQPQKDLQAQLGQERLKKAKEGTEPQKAAAGYARRLEQSEQVFGNLKKSGFNRASGAAAAESKLLNAMKSGNLLSQEQAERNFVNAVLRRESGAAISPSEFASAEQQYFPRLGDTPDVLAQKDANRQQILETLKGSAGPALNSIPLVNVPNAAPKKQAVDLNAMSDAELAAYEEQLTSGR